MYSSIRTSNTIQFSSEEIVEDLFGLLVFVRQIVQQAWRDFDKNNQFAGFRFHAASIRLELAVRVNSC